MNIIETMKNKIKNMDRETKLDTIEISRGYVGGILLGILMFTGVVSGLYAGESWSFETDLEEPIYYTVVGNSSDMTGLNVSFENGNITISTVINFAPDSFTLIFFNNYTQEVEKIVYRDGSTKYFYENVTVNQTVYVPEYIDNTEIIEVEKIIDNIIISETGYELWDIFLAMAIGGAFCWFIMRSAKEEGDE